jgi:GDP-L-fucose synthase
VQDFFARERPRYVFLAAAKVGGILSNFSSPADFIFENLRIQTNVIHEAYRSGVERLVFIGSSCIYPKLASQPIREESLLTGSLEFTNRSYAVAKIAGIEMCWAYNRQHKTSFLAAMLSNLYGPGDNYHPTDSHLIPALMRRMHETKISGAHKVVVWGSGSPRRELLYCDDAADACIFLMNLTEEQFTALINTREIPPLVNVGSGVEMTIREIAELIAQVVGFEHALAYDLTKPDGTPRKLMDTSRMNALGWRPRTGLAEGLKHTYQDFCSRIAEGATVEVGTLEN